MLRDVSHLQTHQEAYYVHAWELAGAVIKQETHIRGLNVKRAHIYAQKRIVRIITVVKIVRRKSSSQFLYNMLDSML